MNRHLQFTAENEDIAACMKSHLIKLDEFGVRDDYDTFFRKRCDSLSRELKKRIIEQDADAKLPSVPADQTTDDEETV